MWMLIVNYSLSFSLSCEIDRRLTRIQGVIHCVCGSARKSGAVNDLYVVTSSHVYTEETCIVLVLSKVLHMSLARFRWLFYA